MSQTIHTGYYHATTGRVRVRVTGIRKRRDAARSLEILMLSQPGITFVRANPLTSNVLVRFDEETISHDAVLQSLADLGHLPVISETRQDRPEACDRFCEVGVALGRKVAKAALRQALRGSPAAIVLEFL